jgi:hypothetical protein
LSCWKKRYAAVKKRQAEKVCPPGRTDRDLWHILVLAVVRHALGTNWDRLEYLANYDQLLRSIMGVHATAFMEDEKIEFSYQTILDNVSLIDEDLLLQINLLVVDAGHKLVKKKEDEALKLKTDSYALETDVHFPTDFNLLWDSSRKCFDMAEALQKIAFLKGWRKIKSIRKTLKSQFRATSQKVFKGKDEHQKKRFVREYLRQAEMLESKVEEVIKNPPIVVAKEVMVAAIIAQLMKYKNYVPNSQIR